jgi:hypothetical protein
LDMRVSREDAVRARTAVPRVPAPLTGLDSVKLALRGNAVRRREAALSCGSFRGVLPHFPSATVARRHLRGRNPHEPENAVSAAMTEILRWWDTIKNPQAHREFDQDLHDTREEVR